MHSCCGVPDGDEQQKLVPVPRHDQALLVPRLVRIVGVLDEVQHLGPEERLRLVRQQHFVISGLSSLVVACSGAVLVGAAPAGPVPRGCAAGDLGDQVCQETADLAERDADEAAARAFGALAAVTAR